MDGRWPRWWAVILALVLAQGIVASGSARGATAAARAVDIWPAGFGSYAADDPLWGGELVGPGSPAQQVYRPTPDSDPAPRSMAVCGCVLVAMADILTLYLGGGHHADETAPWFMNRGLPAFGPAYVNRFLRGTGGFKAQAPACGTEPKPWALTNAGIPATISDGHTSWDTYAGVRFSAHKVSGLPTTSATASLIRHEVDQHRPALIFQSWRNKNTSGRHTYVVTGYEPDGRLHLINPSGGDAPEVLEDKDYEDLMKQITLVWTSEPTHSHDHPLDFLFGFLDDPGQLSITGVGPTGLRTGVDPARAVSFDEDPDGLYWEVPADTSPVGEADHPRDAVGAFYRPGAAKGTYRFTVRNSGAAAGVVDSVAVGSDGRERVLSGGAPERGGRCDGEVRDARWVYRGVGPRGLRLHPAADRHPAGGRH